MLAGLDEPGRDDTELFFDKLRAFIVTHDTSVNEQVRSMHAERVAPDHWDPHTDVISIDTSYSQMRDSIASVLGSASLHNALFHRTVLVLACMHVEMKALIEELYGTLLPPIALYGDPDPEDGELSKEEGVLGLGNIIPHLMDVWNWHDRVKTICRLFVQQLASLYDDKHAQTKFAPYQTVNFASLWYTYFDLMGAVASVEDVINQHEMLTESVNRYMRVMEQVKRHPEKYEDANPEYIEEFGRLVVKIENDLMQRQMLMRIAVMKYELKNVKVGTNDAFFRAFNNNFESYSHKDALARRDGNHPLRMVGIAATFVVMTQLFQVRFAQDSAGFKSMMTRIYVLHGIAPVVPLIGIYAFRTASWLTKKLPMYVTQVTKDPQHDNIRAAQEECRRQAMTFEASIRRAKLDVAMWQSQMLSSFSHDRDKTKALIATRVELLLAGIMFAKKLRESINILLSAFEAAQADLPLPVCHALQHAVDLLITIRGTYHTKSRAIVSLMPILMDHHAFVISNNLYDIYKRLTEELQKGGGGIRPAHAETLTDQQCAVGQALALLSQPKTRQSLLCLDLVLHVAFHRQGGPLEQLLGKHTLDDVFRSFSIMRKIAEFQTSVQEATDCGFLYWHREALLPLFIRSIYKQPTSALRLRSLAIALHDSLPVLLTAKHLKNPQDLQDRFEKFVRKTLDDDMLKPLVVTIETDLGNHTHAEQQHESYKGVSGHSDFAPYAKLTTLPPFRLFGKWYSIATHVEDYFDKYLYERNAPKTSLTTTYDAIRAQAKLRYGLDLLEPELPQGTVEQGLDVLVITQRIQMFITTFTYNLNEQLFVQRPTATEDKKLHTLSIEHVTNAIRTHGTGIMNSTVNHVYRCLLKKLSVVSQFLYDDHIRSKLIKDIRYFNEAKQGLNGRFPVVRAEKLAAEVRKLGVTEDGRSFLDQFREVISEIGNALGYMRLVRSGGLRCVAEAAEFVPSLENAPFFFEGVLDPNAKPEDKEAASEDEEEEEEEEQDFMPQVSGSTHEAVKLVDSALGNLTKRLSDGSDYLLMLLTAIRAKLSDQRKYGHLRHFYMIVPSLCLSYVEMMIHQKERLMKKNKEGLFSDDGFALGCVFLLALFSRDVSDFDSLHWFESVVHHYHEKRTQTKADLNERIEQSRKDGDTMASQTMQLTLTMVEASLAEYTGLQQTFNCCRVFFQAKRKQVKKEEGSSEDEEDDEYEGDD